LEHWLEDCGTAPDDCFAITVAANEACANAVVHAYGPQRGPTLSLVGTRDDASITVEVTDTGRWRAPRRPGGRGLHLMRRLMDDVDVEHDERGTTVRMRKCGAAAAFTRRDERRRARRTRTGRDRIPRGRLRDRGIGRARHLERRQAQGGCL